MYNRYFQFIVGYGLYSLAAAGSMVALPLLVTQRFGMGNELITSLLLRLLPRVVCAPLLGAIVVQRGGKFTIIITTIGLTIGTVALPHVTHYRAFQGLNVCMSILHMSAITALLALRAHIIPPGKNFIANARFAMVERLANIAAPTLISVLLYFCSILYAFCVVGVFFLLTTLVVWTTKIHVSTAPTNTTAPTMNTSYIGLLGLLREKPVLWTMFLPALGFGLIEGAKYSCLLFSTVHIFHNAESQYTSLLTAYGLGALIGSWIAPTAIAWMGPQVSTSTIYLWISLLESIVMASLAWIPTFSGAIIMLGAAGIPEAIVSVCFFTTLQRNLAPQQEGLFYALTFPLFNTAIILGTACSRLYTTSWLGLRQFWLLIIGLNILTILPLLFTTNKRNEQRTPHRL